MIGTIAAAVAMFAGTNIDDIVVLTVLFVASASGGRPRPWQIAAGQYLGLITLVAISVVAALGLVIVPEDWVGLLGLLPLSLGIWGLIRGLRDDGDGESAVVATGLASVAAITIANGADNIAVYTPVFRTLGAPQTAVTIAVFLVCVGLWCAAGRLLGTHKKVIATLERVEHWLVPAVFIGLGVIILLESGVLGRLSAALT
ncbi:MULTISPECIES: cadmium resistance transporter [unclassified Rhodococcus (in: high G+C Gram-positive bacteria)]|uniref:cadmium resistance transporter n=1 Tax=unclassified Rhodococcus (in: high G+C Gram-positive bacteria) TaxID=192944 RepID=UPI0016396F8D|nr:MULTISPECIES: cadmium resistance transporter [unclassified Rhodococcus (in: high G+C Gram-positive bacteria)]MBC2644903.1 cadmium resistance transporter [Rhodococcus sp. 3A]MBC2890905.1 cadmium resistance transporter [Rhodococcus sp. 4CII]